MSHVPLQIWNNIKDGIVSPIPATVVVLYHGAPLSIYLVNRLFAHLIGQSDRQYCRIFCPETGFPTAIDYFSHRPIFQEWNEKVYPQLLKINNWQEFWKTVDQHETFKKKLEEVSRYPDNLLYFKSFLVSCSVDPNECQDGESAMAYLRRASTSGNSNAYANTATNLTLRQICHQLLIIANTNKSDNPNIEQLLYQLQVLINLAKWRAEDRDPREIRCLVEEVWSDLKFNHEQWNWDLLGRKPVQMTQLGYNWVIYQLFVPQNTVEKWVYSSFPGGNPVDTKNKKTWSFTSSKIGKTSDKHHQARIVPGPEFNQQQRSGNSANIRAHTALSLDPVFNALIEQIIAKLAASLINTEHMEHLSK